MLDTEKNLLEALKGEDQLTAAEMVTLTGMPRGTVGSTLRRLLDQKLINELEVPNPNSAGPRLIKAYKLTGNPVTIDIAKRRKTKHQRRTATLAQLKELHDEITRLLKWQTWAISIHPDLGDEPELLEARKLFTAKLPECSFKEQVLSGKADDEPAIQVLVEVLKKQAT